MTAKILQFKKKGESQILKKDWIACGHCGYNGYVQHYDCGADFETVPMCECEINKLQDKSKNQKSIDFSFMFVYNWFKRKH